jgi:hypothetical protein
MTAESGIILGIGIALVLFIVVRRIDRRQHQRKMESLKRKIERSEQAAREQREKASGDHER